MKNSFILLLLLASFTSEVGAFLKSGGEKSWLTLDLFHQSRALPLGNAFVRSPFDPGLQLSHHRSRWGSRAITGGTVIQAGYSQFDRLFWAVNLGGGIEATWKNHSGFFSNYAVRLDYERLFTGSNHFVLENGRYTQKTDYGRSYLRITPMDLSIGYSPKALRELGVIPAVRFAWALDVPLYSGDKPSIWSYTQLGLSINWMIGG